MVLLKKFPTESLDRLRTSDFCMLLHSDLILAFGEHFDQIIEVSIEKLEFVELIEKFVELVQKFVGMSAHLFEIFLDWLDRMRDEMQDEMIVQFVVVLDVLFES